MDIRATSSSRSPNSYQFLPASHPAEAVSLVLNYTTAYQLIHRIAKLHQGESVLIHGAAAEWERLRCNSALSPD